MSVLLHVRVTARVDGYPVRYGEQAIWKGEWARSPEAVAGRERVPIAWLYHPATGEKFMGDAPDFWGFGETIDEQD